MDVNLGSNVIDDQNKDSPIDAILNAMGKIGANKPEWVALKMTFKARDSEGCAISITREVPAKKKEFSEKLE